MIAFNWGVVIGVSFWGAMLDMRQRRLPNYLTIPVFFSGLIWNMCQGGGGALGGALAAATLLALPYIFLFVIGAGGAGDAKMMGALGAWLRLPYGFSLLIAVALSGAVLGVIYGLMRGRGVAAAKNLSFMALWLPWVALGPGRVRDRAAIWPTEQAMTRMPYGVAIFMGACLAAGGVWLWRL